MFVMNRSRIRSSNLLWFLLPWEQTGTEVKYGFLQSWENEEFREETLEILCYNMARYTLGRNIWFCVQISLY